MLSPLAVFEDDVQSNKMPTSLPAEPKTGRVTKDRHLLALTCPPEASPYRRQ
jgi:hypothetical protein